MWWKSPSLSKRLKKKITENKYVFEVHAFSACRPAWLWITRNSHWRRRPSCWKRENYFSFRIQLYHSHCPFKRKGYCCWSTSDNSMTDRRERRYSALNILFGIVLSCLVGCFGLCKKSTIMRDWWWICLRKRTLNEWWLIYMHLSFCWCSSSSRSASEMYNLLFKSLHFVAGCWSVDDIRRKQRRLC
jgi:hypothetical protein